MSRDTQDTYASFQRGHIAGTSERNELHVWPRLIEDDVAPHNHGQHMQLNPGNGVHVIPGLQVVDSTANEDAVNEHLLVTDQQDTDAVRILLGVKIPNNMITAQHYYRILEKLRELLFPAKRIKHILSEDFPAKEYERVFLRLARTCNTPSLENYKACGCVHPPLDFGSVHEAFQESTAESSHSVSYVECIDNLLGSLSAGFQMMQQTGTAEDVYIVTKDDGKEFVERLLYLAALLHGSPG